MKLENLHIIYIQKVLAAACIDGCEIHRCNACYYQWFQTCHVVPYDDMTMSKHVGVVWLLNQILYVHLFGTCTKKSDSKCMKYMTLKSITPVLICL
jgi:hypothetical protein